MEVPKVIAIRGVDCTSPWLVKREGKWEKSANQSLNEAIGPHESVVLST